MWLINIKSMKLEEFTPPHLPTYAILSHTWEDDEVTFQEFGNLKSAKKRAGFVKIKKTCELAAAKDIPYAWVDTCCIDKSSSAELSEAINSMFDWYKLSAVCFAYLSDLKTDASKPPTTLWRDEEQQLVCRWFQRGWTLQELLAPAKLEFYDSAWQLKGLKTDWWVVRQLLSMTGIRSEKVFQNSYAIREIAVGERMSWASNRQTKRIEDLAYCLLGIFQVNMPMLYGEGTRAFQRLQEEIMRNSADMSLFCWKVGLGGQKYRGLLARSPVEFASYYDTFRQSQNRWHTAEPEKEFVVTNKGIRIEADLGEFVHTNGIMTALRCTLPPDDHVVFIPLRHYRESIYVRQTPDSIMIVDLVGTQMKTIYIAKDIDSEASKALAERMDSMNIFDRNPLPPAFRYGSDSNR